MGNRESSAPSDADEEPVIATASGQVEAKGPGNLKFDENLTYDDIYVNNPKTDSEASLPSNDSLYSIDADEDISDNESYRAFAGIIQLSISYSLDNLIMTIRIKGTSNIAGRKNGGSSGYQVILIILPEEKYQFMSSIRSGPNPNFSDEWRFRITEMEARRSILQCELYGYENEQVQRLHGSKILHLDELNLGLDNAVNMHLSPRPADVDTSGVRVHQEIAIQQLQMVPLSYQSSEALQRPASSCGELLIGILYRQTTGMCEIHIQQARLKAGIFPGRNAPSTYVGVLLQNSDGVQSGKAKTKVIRRQQDPFFNERLVFTIARSDINTMSLIFNLFTTAIAKRKNRVGSCIIGYNEIPLEGHTHWEQILDAKGRQVTRWHPLIHYNEDIVGSNINVTF